MKRITKALSFLLAEYAAWGLKPSRKPAAGAPKIRVLLPVDNGPHRHVGDLSQEPDGEFVFKYAFSYRSASDAEPLAAFPDLNEEYRSPELFPFFAVRLPPSDRADVRAALQKMKVDSDDTLRILGRLARKGISNPYQFELAEP